MKALDICAGAGGLSLGLQRAGFDVLGLELDQDACDTHRRHVGPCEAADLRTWFPPHHFDLVAGGPPCQPFSVAGLGLADADERYLIPDFLRIARHAHARAIMIENVRGLVTRHPRVFRAVLDACEAEYLTTWTILNAAHYGVPQNRERLFIVGFRDAADRARFRWPLPSHAPPGELFGAPHRTVRQVLGPHEALAAELVAAGLADRPSTTVSAAAGGRVPPAGHHIRQLNGAVKLSPQQCAALQAFPPGWTFTGNMGSQHRQIGNAVPPPLAEALARAVMIAFAPYQEQT